MTARSKHPLQTLKHTLIIVQMLQYLKHAYYVKFDILIDDAKIRLEALNADALDSRST
jgi:hypothetical protein